MKPVFLILFSVGIVLASCTEKKELQQPLAPELTERPVELPEIPDVTVAISALQYDNSVSLWTLNGQSYSGHAVRYYPGSILQERICFWKGKKQNQAIQWYPDGHYKQVANYHLGKLHGEKKRWSHESTHVLLAHLNYHAGKAHGEQTQWYPTGELFKKVHLNMGREEGIQQAYRKNGVVFANYEAKNGRIFGLKKAALCYDLEAESIK